MQQGYNVYKISAELYVRFIPYQIIMKLTSYRENK